MEREAKPDPHRRRLHRHVSVHRRKDSAPTLHWTVCYADDDPIGGIIPVQRSLAIGSSPVASFTERRSWPLASRSKPHSTCSPPGIEPNWRYFLISTVIHRLQPDLDARQLAVVGHLEGPLLVIAVPGAGKTRTVVWRAVNLLLLGRVSPAELLMCTFSKRPPTSCASGSTSPPIKPAAPEICPPCASPPCTACAAGSCANTTGPPA